MSNNANEFSKYLENCSVKISEEDFNWFKNIIYKVSGINLHLSKKELLQARLKPHITKIGLHSYTDYKNYLSTLPPDHAEWTNFIGLITTNKTEFFREHVHFDWLINKFIPEWTKLNLNRKLRIWSCACSTGEEPYSISMLLNKYYKGEFEIIATDIDEKVLTAARNGVYHKHHVTGIGPEYQSYISKGTEDIKDWFRIKNNIRENIVFQKLNLLNTPYPWRNAFDVIFCRNVFIYFDQATISKILDGLYRATTMHGQLLIGMSESLQNIEHDWAYIKPSIFLKNYEYDEKYLKNYAKNKVTEFKQSDNISSNIHVKSLPVNINIQNNVSKITKTSGKKKVLIVEDSKTMREIIKQILQTNKNLEIVGIAPDVPTAEQMLFELKPDVITLDLNLPGKDGISFLQSSWPKYKVPVVIISSFNRENSPQALTAMELGAVEYIQKPSLAEISLLQDEIAGIVEAAAQINVSKNKSMPVNKVKKAIQMRTNLKTKTEVIAIGASTGGVQSLRWLLNSLSEGLPPIIIAQHIPKDFSRAFAEDLNKTCCFKVKEAENGDICEPNHVYVAPGGVQLKIEKNSVGKITICITDDPPVNRHKPSVDYLFQSVAKSCGPNVIALLLTGMGADGANGLLQIKKQGAFTVAQDEASSIVFGMPKAAIEINAASEIWSLNSMPEKLLTVLG